MEERVFRKWRRAGILTDKACKRFYCGGCPRGYEFENTEKTPDKQVCRTCEYNPETRVQRAEQSWEKALGIR